MPSASKTVPTPPCEASLQPILTMMLPLKVGPLPGEWGLLRSLQTLDLSLLGSPESATANSIEAGGRLGHLPPEWQLLRQLHTLDLCFAHISGAAVECYNMPSV